MIQSSLFSAYLPNSCLWEQILIVFTVIWSQLEPTGHHPTPALLELWCLGGWCRLCWDPLALAFAPASRNSVGQESDPCCSQGMDGGLLVNGWTQQLQHHCGLEHRGTLCPVPRKPPWSSHSPRSPELFPCLGLPPLPGTESIPGEQDVGAALGTPPGHPALVNPSVGYFPLFPAEMD